MFDVHFGVSSEAFTGRAVLPYEGSAHWGTDGDGWNAWGEDPGTDRNDEDTLHVIVNCGTLGQAIDLALRYEDLYGRDLLPLLPMNSTIEDFTSQDGTLLVVSQHRDWAEQYLLVTEREVRTLANRVVED